MSDSSCGGDWLSTGFGTTNLDKTGEVLPEDVSLRERLDQGLQLTLAVGVRLRGQRVVDPATLASSLHDSRHPEDREMAGDVRLGQLQHSFQMADAQLPVGQQRDDAQASLVGQSLEEPGDES